MDLKSQEHLNRNQSKRIIRTGLFVEDVISFKFDLFFLGVLNSVFFFFFS